MLLLIYCHDSFLFIEYQNCYGTGIELTFEPKFHSKVLKIKWFTIKLRKLIYYAIFEIEIKSRNGQSRPPAQVPKKQSDVNMRRHSIVKCLIEFTAPKNTRRDKTQQQPFPNWKKYRSFNIRIFCLSEKDTQCRNKR